MHSTASVSIIPMSAGAASVPKESRCLPEALAGVRGGKRGEPLLFRADRLISRAGMLAAIFAALYFAPVVASIFLR
ncbi:MAG: hypothetical protein GX155_00420 [Smithella sp.]|jgi:hypothetical protein|nr:hypothetical protein [Smithella sp.]